MFSPTSTYFNHFPISFQSLEVGKLDVPGCPTLSHFMPVAPAQLLITRSFVPQRVPAGNMNVIVTHLKAPSKLALWLIKTHFQMLKNMTTFFKYYKSQTSLKIELIFHKYVFLATSFKVSFYLCPQDNYLRSFDFPQVKTTGYEALYVWRSKMGRREPRVDDVAGPRISAAGGEEWLKIYLKISTSTVDPFSSIASHFYLYFPTSLLIALWLLRIAAGLGVKNTESEIKQPPFTFILAV